MCCKEISKKKSMILETLIFISLIIIPYGIFGFNLVNLILLILPLIYLRKSKVIYGDKMFMIIWGCYFISAIISLFISSNNIVSIVGISTYFSLGIFYITFNSIMKNDVQKQKILTIMVWLLAILTIGFIILQWIIFDVRISGNITYANSYALMLLIGIYINGEIKNIII